MTYTEKHPLATHSNQQKPNKARGSPAHSRWPSDCVTNLREMERVSQTLSVDPLSLAFTYIADHFLSLSLLCSEAWPESALCCGKRPLRHTQPTEPTGQGHRDLYSSNDPSPSNWHKYWSVQYPSRFIVLILYWIPRAGILDVFE